jgi:hypothetical protein
MTLSLQTHEYIIIMERITRSVIVACNVPIKYGFAECYYRIRLGVIIIIIMACRALTKTSCKRTKQNQI